MCLCLDEMEHIHVAVTELLTSVLVSGRDGTLSSMNKAFFDYVPLCSTAGTNC